MTESAPATAIPKWLRALTRFLLTGVISYAVAWPVTGFIDWVEVKYGDRSGSALSIFGAAVAFIFDVGAYPFVSGCVIGSYGCQFNLHRVLIAAAVLFIVLLASQFRAFYRLLKNG